MLQYLCRNSINNFYGSVGMNAGVDYKLFYEILLNLRESFHSYGRIDDSNMKLDEIVKILMLSYYEALQGERFSLLLVRDYAKNILGDDAAIAMALRKLFDESVEYPLFKNVDGTSVYGANPSLNIQSSENLFAERLISEVEKIDFVNLIENKPGKNFDILNECFGHFVRENFRNNKEDAQYMTPAEITIPILSVVFNDFDKENYFSNIDPSTFTIMDPTCGVGTLIVESARKYIDYLHHHGADEDTIQKFLSHSIIGQDKVDRMVRFSKINTLLLGANSQNIYIGNSISEDTYIDSMAGKVDFIFTNPPFGAEYAYSDLDYNKFCYLSELPQSGSTLSSEVLMLLKCLHLLKPNGKLAIVLPDGIFSSKGINVNIRNYLLENYTINAVFEMPVVTFAQAGTRTKTSILYLTKTKPDTNQRIVMGVCDDIGYVVKERNGVPVKIAKGTNQMMLIAEKYNTWNSMSRIISSCPSVTSVYKSELINTVLNPTFYRADRLEMLDVLDSSSIDGYEMRNLTDVVRFETIGRKNKNVDEKTKHISVLHINADCTINFQQVQEFNPISKGRLCHEGDILFSKINPRIPRMTVVPQYDDELVCSNEFEIMRPCSDVGAHVICLMLKTPYVSKQIENLTSGTSSSHSRIKREQLGGIQIPYPISTEKKKLFRALNEKIKLAFEQKYDADGILQKQLRSLSDIL